MENNILKIIDETTDLLRNIEGLTGSDAFEEVIKVFFTLNQNKSLKTCEEVKKLFTEDLSKRYDFFVGKNIKLKDLTLNELIKTFHKINFESEDIKGRLFEGFLGRVFTSGLGQFFTPREIVNFITDFLRKNNLIPKNGIILDPACGSSGILIKSQTGTQKIVGYDINERLVRVSKMNMVIHNVSNFEINNDSFLNAEINDVDLVVTNPPFGVDERQKEILNKFKFGVNKNKTELEILFLEKIINILKPGGICAIVLPDGIFNNVSLKNVRNHILEYCDIIASIDLPENVFKSTGTGCETGILILQKKEKENKKLKSFNAYRVDFVGYETQTKFAKKIKENDLIEIINNNNYDKKIEVDSLNDSLRIDAKFYLREFLEKNKPSLSIFEQSGEKVNKIYKDDDLIKYVQYSDIDPVFGTIKSYTEMYFLDAPSRAKIVVRENDILIPKLRQSIDKVAIVTSEYDGCVVTNGFYVIKPKKNISVNYVFGILRKKQIQNQLVDYSSGTIMPSVDDCYFSNVKYEIEEEDEYNIIDQKITNVFNLIKSAKTIMNSLSS